MHPLLQSPLFSLSETVGGFGPYFSVVDQHGSSNSVHIQDILFTHIAWACSIIISLTPVFNRICGTRALSLALRFGACLSLLRLPPTLHPGARCFCTSPSPWYYACEGYSGFHGLEGMVDSVDCLFTRIKTWQHCYNH